MPLRISLSEIRSPDDALEMAACRNQVRSFMTHDQREILPADQLKWYHDSYLPKRTEREAFGFVVRQDLDPIGYGLITDRQDRWWVSGGIVAAARGHSYGRFLFGGLTKIIHEGIDAEEAWLDVYRGNEPAVNLYRSLGYMAVEDHADIMVMVHRDEALEAA